MTCCKICAEPAKPFARAGVLSAYEARFIRCTSCGFIWIDEPDWLAAAYVQAINETDLGLLSRNVSLAQRSARLIATCFDSNAEFLDFGGGYGVFVRLMRDQGFRFSLYEEHASNLFADGFSVGAEELGEYEIITAFEVIEHLPDPLEQMVRLLDHTGTILLSTELLPRPAPRPEEWWYYGLEHGQHVSFFTREALRALAKRTGTTYATNGASLHLLTDRKIGDRRFRLITSSRAGLLLDPLLARRFAARSLLQSDVERLAGGLGQ